MEPLKSKIFIEELIKNKYKIDEARLSKKLESNPDFVRDFAKTFDSDLFAKSLSYSSGEHLRSPILEEKIKSFVQDIGGEARFSRAQVFLSHDIDYLYSTVQLVAKRLIGYRKFSGYRRSYLESISEIFEISRSFAKERGRVAAFVAAPTKSSAGIDFVKEWLIDPSYSLEEDIFAEFLKIVDRFSVEIGLHGSLNSIAKERLNAEKSLLEKRVGKGVSLNRQHWLNLPDKNAFGLIESCQLRVDSSLGWNGAIGYRGGLLGPFLLPGTHNLVEIPLVAMDGSLFDDLGYSDTRAIDELKSVLSKSFDYGGVFSLDWHDRAADKSYRWVDVYRKILEWLESEGITAWDSSPTVRS